VRGRHALADFILVFGCGRGTRELMAATLTASKVPITIADTREIELKKNVAVMKISSAGSNRQTE